MAGINITKIEKKFGKVLLQWQFYEFEKVTRGDMWFVIMGLIGSAFLIYSLYTGDFLFALIIILVFFIVFLRQTREPAIIDFLITEQGIILDNYFYAFHEVKAFWIIYQPPEVKYLYLQMDKTMSMVKRIPLQDINPLYVRELLLPVIEEDLSKEDEPFADTLGRWIKLQ